MKKELKVLLLSLIVVGLAGATALATTIDLTTGGSSGTAAAAIGGTFQVFQMDQEPTGTGVLDPFLRIQQTGQERGYNTSLGGPLDDKTGIWTHALELSTVGVVTLSGIPYREFILDINQTAASSLLSLNQVQMFLGDDTLNYSLAEASGTNNALISFAGYNEVFRMNNVSGSNVITLDYSLNSGSGSGDMFLYVPNSAFGGVTAGNLIFFSQFGTPPGSYFSNDGFEEWAVKGGVSVPEPGTMLLLTSGLIGLIGYGRKKSFNKSNVRFMEGEGRARNGSAFSKLLSSKE